MECYRAFEEYNRTASKGKRKTQEDLTDLLNERMNLNKSSTAYRKVWRGHIDRETLAIGKEEFTI